MTLVNSQQSWRVALCKRKKDFASDTETRRNPEQYKQVSYVSHVQNHPLLTRNFTPIRKQLYVHLPRNCRVCKLLSKAADADWQPPPPFH